MATKKRQLKMLLIFMALFGAGFLYCLLNKEMDLVTKCVGCGLFGGATALLIDTYFEVIKR